MQAENFTCWVYVPNPPLLRPVTWGEPSIPIYINDSSWTCGPEDDRLLLHPSEEGSKCNITLGFKDRPVCIEATPRLLKVRNAGLVIGDS